MFGPLLLLHEKQASARFRCYSLAPMLSGKDMINLKRDLIVIAWHLAIFADPMRALPDKMY